MGGGPDKETLVFVFPSPEPKHLTAQLRQKFPYIDVIFYQLNMSKLKTDEKQIGGIRGANLEAPDGKIPITFEPSLLKHK